MPRGELYHVYEFTNDDHDGSPHYAVMGLDATSKPAKFLRILSEHNPKIKIDVDQKLASYNSKAEAETEARRRGVVADQLNPDRIGADKAFPPGEANRILDVGRPASELNPA